MGLPVMSYETWIEGHEAIQTGGQVLDVFITGLSIAVPPLAAVLEAASLLLGWAVAKIWDALPHEEPPEPHSAPSTHPVQDPRWVVKRNKDTPILENAYKTYQSMDSADRLAGLLHTPTSTPDMQPLQPSVPVNVATPNVEVGLHTFPKREVIREEYTLLNQRRKKGTGMNPTFGRIGF